MSITTELSTFDYPTSRRELSQVAMRAGHDPAVAGRHYTGRVDETDRRLASDLGDMFRNLRESGS